MKIELQKINRSFSLTKQIKQFEPRNFFASYGVEGTWTDKEEKELSKKLYLKAKEDCENALEEYLEATKKETINEEKKKNLPF